MSEMYIKEAAKEPERVALFEKVSRKEYIRCNPSAGYIAFVEDNYARVVLPTRSTKMSAGYDFHSPNSFSLKPQETTIVHTYVHAKMCPNAVLLVFPRSSVAIKKGVTLLNSVAVVDADYTNADNEGHIMIAFKNNNKRSIFPWVNKKNTWIVNEGDKIAQGVFVQYGITFDDASDADRTGGIGSTGV